MTLHQKSLISKTVNDDIIVQRFHYVYETKVAGHFSELRVSVQRTVETESRSLRLVSLVMGSNFFQEQYLAFVLMKEVTSKSRFTVQGQFLVFPIDTNIQALK
ncbi:hypothetical protein ACU8KH_03781 [Lachancea thermotolerans]